MGGIVKIIKNWVGKTSTTALLADESPADAIIYSKPSNYAGTTFFGGFLWVVDSDDSLRSKIRRLYGFFRPEIPSLPCLTAGRTVC